MPSDCRNRNSSRLTNDPVGLFGFTSTMARVRGVTAAASASQSMDQPPWQTSGYETMRSDSMDARNSNSGYDGRGASTSSPGSVSSLKRYAYASLVLAV